jgi:hypothetical protein
MLKLLVFVGKSICKRNAQGILRVENITFISKSKIKDKAVKCYAHEMAVCTVHTLLQRLSRLLQFHKVSAFQLCMQLNERESVNHINF